MDEEKVEQSIRYAHDVGFDEGYQCGYEDGYADAMNDTCIGGHDKDGGGG